MYGQQSLDVIAMEVLCSTCNTIAIHLVSQGKPGK